MFSVLVTLLVCHQYIFSVSISDFTILCFLFQCFHIFVAEIICNFAGVQSFSEMHILDDVLLPFALLIVGRKSANMAVPSFLFISLPTMYQNIKVVKFLLIVVSTVLHN